MKQSMRPVNIVMGGALAIFAVYLMGGCPTPAPKPPIVDASDAALEDAVVRNPSCASACEQLAKLGCPEGRTLDGGKSCLHVCEDAEASGKFSLKPACVIGAQTIEQLRLCGTVRCQK